MYNFRYRYRYEYEYVHVYMSSPPNVCTTLQSTTLPAYKRGVQAFSTGLLGGGVQVPSLWYIPLLGNSGTGSYIYMNISIGFW